MSADALAVAIDIEFDGSGRNDAGKTRAKTSEKGSPAFSTIDVADYSSGLVACAESTVSSGPGGRRRVLIEIGLKTCSEDIEGGRGDCRCESTAPGAKG